MIYTLTDSFCLDLSILLAFPKFCRSDFSINCKSKVDKITIANLALYQNEIFSPDPPDRIKNLPFEITPEMTFVGM